MEVVVWGGGGLGGRHLVKTLLERGARIIWIIDDLSTGRPPREWLSDAWKRKTEKTLDIYRKNGREITFVKEDALTFFYAQAKGTHSLKLPDFGDVFHLASIVGGRALIEGDPILIATDLGIDAVFFLWLTRRQEKVGRVLYASSSASYPIKLQGKDGALALQEKHLDFSSGYVGVPDLTYGWSKLTGEFLAKLAHEKYGVHIACVRPFSGYGEDQDLTYPTPSIALRVARGDDPIEVWGTGKQGRDFVHIDDCTDAFFAILDKVNDGSGINIGTGTATSFIALIEEMLKIEGRAGRVKPLVDKPIGVETRYADTSNLFKRVGWRPKISLQEGLKRVLAGAHERLNGRDLPFQIT